MVGQHAVGDAGRVAEELAAGGGGGRDRVPLGERLRARPGIVSGATNRFDVNADRPHQHLHRHQRALAAERQARGRSRATASRTAATAAAPPPASAAPTRAVDPPADDQPADHQHGELQRRVGEVGGGPAEGTATLLIGSDRNRSVTPFFESSVIAPIVVSMPNIIDSANIPGSRYGQVVAAARQLDGAAEEVAEDQQQHDRERDPEDRCPRLALPVLEVAQGDHPAVAEAWRRRSSGGSFGGGGWSAVRCRKTSSRVGRRSSTSSTLEPGARRATRTAAISAAEPPASPASTVTSRRSGSAAAVEDVAQRGPGRWRRTR